MSTKEYIKNVIKDPKVASITPTSKSGVREICGKMDFSNQVVIVEYGPATGVFTEYLLKRMSADSLLIAVELNENFAKYLKEHIQDPRLRVHHDNAAHIDSIMASYGKKANYVLSGIPFSLIPDKTRSEIVKKTHDILHEGGKFIAYQTFFQRDKHLLDHLNKHFSSVDDQYFLKNIPPMRVYEAVK